MAKLTGNERVADIVDSLADAEGYVRGILGNMAEYRRRRIEPIVRIGSTGQGIVPHYRLEPKETKDEAADIADVLDAYFEHMRVYNGRNHTRLDWGAVPGSWGTLESRVDEFQ